MHPDTIAVPVTNYDLHSNHSNREFESPTKTRGTENMISSILNVNTKCVSGKVIALSKFVPYCFLFQSDAYKVQDVSPV